MEENTNEIVRYSDTDLAEFKTIVEKKLQKAKEELNYLMEQILEISENSSDDHGGDWMDDSNINNDIEFLNNMAIRQRKYIQDLENALVRINNKTYGICMVTGKLIEKRRLIAVPTATKSVEGKAAQAESAQTKKKKEEEDEEEKLEHKKKLSKAKTEPKIITKVIKKPTKPAPKPVDLDDDDDDDLGIDDDNLGIVDDDVIEISSTDDDLEDAAGSEDPDVFDDDDENDDI